MWRKIFLCSIVVLFLALIAPVSATNAQGTNGSIRGVVYNDLNADGFCVGTGEPGQSGVPIEFGHQAGDTTIPLMTGVDGSYGIVYGWFNSLFFPVYFLSSLSGIRRLGNEQ